MMRRCKAVRFFLSKIRNEIKMCGRNRHKYFRVRICRFEREQILIDEAGERVDF